MNDAVRLLLLTPLPVLAVLRVEPWSSRRHALSGGREFLQRYYAAKRDADMELTARSGTLEDETLLPYVDEFVSTVSHELRTPLTSIGGYLLTLSRVEVDAFRTSFGLDLGHLATDVAHVAETTARPAAGEARHRNIGQPERITQG